MKSRHYYRYAIFYVTLIIQQTRHNVLLSFHHVSVVFLCNCPISTVLHLFSMIVKIFPTKGTLVRYMRKLSLYNMHAPKNIKQVVFIRRLTSAETSIHIIMWVASTVVVLIEKFIQARSWVNYCRLVYRSEQIVMIISRRSWSGGRPICFLVYSGLSACNAIKSSKSSECVWQTDHSLMYLYRTE